MESKLVDNHNSIEKIVKFYRRRIFSFINSLSYYQKNHLELIEKELAKIMNKNFLKQNKIPICEVKSKIKEESKICEEMIKNTTARLSNVQISIQKFDIKDNFRNTVNNKRNNDNTKINVKLKENKDAVSLKNIELKKAKISNLTKGDHKKSKEDFFEKTLKNVQQTQLTKKLISKDLNSNLNKSNHEKDAKINKDINKNSIKNPNNLVNNITRVDPNQKYYLVSGGYPDVIEALKKCGYKESHNSDVFDFNWSLKTGSINYKKLKTSQIVNHFNNNKEFTSKIGLCKNIRSLILKQNIEIDTFYPRCYDLEDKHEFEDFIEDFKFQKAEALLKEFALGIRRISEEKLKTSIEICERKLNYYFCLKEKVFIYSIRKKLPV